MKEELHTQLRRFYIYKRRYFKFDFVAALIVFLVAIPLCLGIALASGTPLFSGVVSGIVGGIIVGTLSGSEVSVAGPAAGMAGVVLAALTQLGGFPTFLLALTFAGLIQVILGLFRAGFIAEYIPSNVVQGLLCAIGILLIVKQIPLAFSLSTNLDEFKANLLESTEGGLPFNIFFDLAYNINAGATIISCISFALLIFSDKTKAKWLKHVPVPISVVIIGTIINEVFLYSNSFLAQSSPYLVNIPEQASIRDFLSQFTTPHWQDWTKPNVYAYAFIIAIIASLETLLNIKAAEKLDQKRRSCSKDRELVAQGIGNVVVGLIGGVPLTSVIARTSVNIQSGAKTKVSAILHGFFILIAVSFLAKWLNKIPLSSLASILIFTGYKLTKPSIYKEIYYQGLDRFIPFLATLITIVMFNLLTGILIGLAISLFYILKSNSKARFDIIKEIYPTGIINRLILPQQISFLNTASLIAELNSIPKNSRLIIDARYSNYIDKEIIELLKEFKKDQAPHKQIALNLIGFQDKYDIHNYIDFINVTTYDILATLDPHQVLNLLREGNQRFLKGTRIHRSTKTDIRFSAQTPHPIAIILGCIDSRVPVETIFDMSFGDLFCVRIAGNVINEDVLASIEYACNVVGAKLILVLAHTRCGAIQAACDDIQQGYITQLINKIKPAVKAETTTLENRNSTNVSFVKNVTYLNLLQSLEKIYNQSEVLREMIDAETIGIVGAMYDVSTGQVNFDDYLVEETTVTSPSHHVVLEKIRKILNAAKICPNGVTSAAK